MVGYLEIMMSCLAELTLASESTGFGMLSQGLVSNFALVEPGLILGQALKWLPSWLTPLWLIAVGLLLGAIASAVVYGLLALLSFIPGLGTIADSPRRGVIASLLVGAVVAAGLCAVYVPRAEAYSESLFLPLTCIGLLVGFGVIYGLWSRTRNEWGQILSEGVVPYLLSVAGVFG